MKNDFAFAKTRQFAPLFGTQFLGALLFVLPYFLFSTLAGQLATRFDKARLARAVKVFEMAIMALAGWGFSA